MKILMSGTSVKMAVLIAALSFCLVVIPRSGGATPDPQAGPNYPMTGPQVSPNLAIDPYGRVIDLTFPQEITVSAPWDRFRFDINIVRPLARDAGAFLGDLTGDGLTDLVMPSFTGETLFFPGVGGGPLRFGSGSYLRHTQATPAENPFSFIPGDWHQGDIGDLDGDGVKDAVIGSALYRNAGTGSEPMLDPVYTFTGGGTFDPSASIGDLNADGKLDVVITWNYANGNSHIYWNNSTPGNFSFTRQALNNPHASSSQHLALGDINGDGLLDLVCPEGIYLNSGTPQVPSFDFVLSPWNKTGGPAWPATSDQPSHVVLRDGDGDGLLDAYVSDLSTTLFQVLFYKNVGTAAAHSLTYVGPVVCDAGPTDVYYHGETTPSWSGSRALAATGDIDNNGSADVLLTPSQAAGFSYPTILWNYPAAGGSHTLGYQDLYTYPSLERISPSCGADSFTSPDAACGPPNVFGGWKDVTGDGAADALRLNQGANFSLYKRVRSGTLPFTLGPDIAVNTPSGPQAAAYGLAWVDVDLDNRVDVIGGDEDGHLRWYRNIATDGSFVPADPVLLADLSGTPIDVGQQSWPAAIDLDGDSDLDLLVSNYSGNILEVFCVTPGDPHGYALGPQLGTPQQNPLDLSDVVGGGLIAPTLTTIDVNGDGRVDVVAGDPSGRLWLLRNVATTGTASFVLEPLVISRTQAAYLEAVDTHTVRLRFALPAAIGARISFHDVVTPEGPVSGEVTLLSPALGNYSDASVQLGANTTVTPDTAPITAASLSASTTTAFKGTLAADPATGVVHITNAQPAGTYLVTVTAFNSAGTKTFTLTVNNPTPCDSLHFSAASGSPVTVGSLPAFEAVGDFNGDGNQDFAVANWGANNVTVLLGNGSGGFSAATGSPFAVGSHPTSIAVGDFDGNGRQDLAFTKDGLFDNVTVLLGNGSGGFSPATGSPFDAGYTPQSVAVGDFNGDGKPDLATANWNSNNVTVLLGNGGGGFSTAAGSPFPAGTNPASVAIGDFNGDGKADLTIANRYANSVTVLLGNGSGGFSAAIGSPFSVGANPTSVTVGDFNRDGKLDLATANRGASNVTVLLGDGSGSFSPATGSPFAIGSGPLSVACGDFNGDGKLDLTTANIDSNNVTVLLGNGSGGFSAAAGSPFAVGSSPYLVAVGDFNGDAKLDLASVNDGSNNVSVLLNTCTSNTAPTISAADITRQQELRSANAIIANVNDLEDPETALNVTVNGGTSATVNGVMVSIISTSATGVVTASVVTNCTATTATFTLRVADTGGLFNEATLTVTIIPNTAPALTYAIPQSVVFGGSLNVTPTAAGDNGTVSYTVQPGHGLTTAPTVDSNGVVSITNAQPSGAHTITIRATDNCGVMTDAAFTLEVQPQPPTLGAYPNTSVVLSANATVTPDAPPANTTSINVSTSTNFKGKLEGDPSTGIVRATDAHPAGAYTVTVTALNSGAGATTKTFTLMVTTPATCNPVSFAAATNFGVGTDPVAVAVGDFNGDGHQDLASANETANNVSILLGTGTGGFGEATNFSVGTYPFAVAIGDFNGDGKQDLAVANSGSGNVSILLGTGTGSFGAATNFAANSGAMSVAVGDFNGDGKQDLATANTSSDSSHTVSILLGTGTGSFGAPTDFVVGNRPDSLAVGDFNGDGHQDLAVANESFASLSVSILLGTGTGSFGAATNFGVGGDPVSVAVGDFNGDGHQDLATANYWTSNLSILLGTGTGSFAAATNIGVGDRPSSVAVGDFNGDGKQDLATVHQASNNASILLGTGTGSFGAEMNFSVGISPTSVAIGDFNGGGQQDLAVANSSSNNVTVMLNTCTSNTAPTISPVPVTRQQGSASANATIANVNDLEDLKTALNVTVNGGPSATVNGVTVSGISVSASGVVTADVVASCTATTATFTLRVTDTGALFNEATLTVTVNPNTLPILTYASPQSVIFGGVLNVVPTSLSDNGAVTYQVMPGHGLTSVPTVDSNGVVSIINTQPEGGHFVTIRATDNCGAVTDASFSIDVGAMPAFAINNVSHNEGDTGTLSYTFTVTKTGNTAASSSVNFTTVDGTATIANNDYQTNSGVLNFSPTDTSRPITVVVNCDTAVEPDESFTVHLSAPSGARITAGDGTGAIINDDCTISLSNNAENFTAAGGAASVTLTTSSACTWTAVSNDAFITINSGASGFGNGTVNYSVAVNTGPSRTGTMTIAAQTFTVTQDSGCTFVLSSASQNFVAGGGTNSVNVITATGCQWAAVSNNAFITIDSGSTGSGNGTVGYEVAVNPGPPRTGTMTIAGITFTVTQDGGCAFTLNRDHQSFPGNGGNGAVNVTSSDPGCAWTASTTSTFVTITSGGSGTGNGTVQYTVAANEGSTIRSETITIAGHTFTVYQGINFLDVPSTDPFYNEIGKLAARGVTLGCTADHTLYCPNDPVTREQMAAFILRAKGEFNPPLPTSQRFGDVQPQNVFYSFIDRLAESQITLGCTPDHLMYCPADPVKREQMAAFILRGLGEFNPPIPSSQRFDDVPPANVFYNFIDRLAVLNITLGCTPDHVMYCPGDSVTRAQMAAFLVRAFDL